ncbi:MAG: site-specific integrase, partial [Oscillospiraceae bacterium]|nr:site-specific integrase [Oscillospiraceae bacterium]
YYTIFLAVFQWFVRYCLSSTMQRIQIEDSLTKTEVIITEPKSKSSIREIPLNDELCSFLKKYYDNLPTDAFLLTGKNDRFIEPRLLEYKFKKYIKECSLDNINFHALRHTFATRCVENGFEIKTLSEILGHVNVNITLNRYVHSSMEMKRINMERMSKIFR